jgi:hypothetical protein
MPYQLDPVDRPSGCLELDFKNLKEILKLKTTIKHIIDPGPDGNRKWIQCEILWKARISPYSIAQRFRIIKLELAKLTAEVLYSENLSGRINEKKRISDHPSEG